MTISPLAASLSGVAAILVVLFMTSRWRTRRRENAIARVLPPLVLAAFLSAGFVGGIQVRQAEHASLRLQMSKAKAEARTEPVQAVALEAVGVPSAEAPPTEQAREPARVEAQEQELALAVPVPAPAPSAQTPDQPQRRAHDVPIYFGTDRAVIGDAKRDYGALRAGRLEMGRALVTLPSDDRRNTTGHEARFTQSATAREAIATLDAVETLALAEFLLKAGERARQSEVYKGQALLFVHGMSTSFEHAALSAAGIAGALAFDGPILLYSWPAGSEVTSYSYDSASAAGAVPYLREFLDLSRDLAPEGLNVVAYGMGSELVLRALDIATNHMPASPIREIVLVAPDMDTGALKARIDGIRGRARGFTLYVSSKDRALTVARHYFGGKARAGDISSAGPMVIPGVDTIDVSAVADDPLEAAVDRALGSDLEQLMKTGARAERRLPSEARIATGAGVYWSYR